MVNKHVAIVASVDLESNRLPKLLEFYSRRGFQVSFWGCIRDGAARPQAAPYGADVKYILRGRFPGKTGLLRLLVPWIYSVRRAVLSYRPSLVHVLELESAIGVWAAAVQSGIPYIYDVMDNYDLRYRYPYLVKRAIQEMDSKVIGRSERTIVPDTNRVVGPFARWPGKMLILPNCPPDLRPKQSIPRESQFTVLALGHLSARRGIGLLLDAMEGIEGVRVVMVGKFDDEGLERRARQTANVEVRGWIPYENALLLGCQGHLMYSFYDPSYEINIRANSQKWFDAMMCGIPVLVNSEVANAGWIRDEGFGLLCPYGDVDALRGALFQARDNLAGMDEMGKTGRRMFERDYDWNRRQLDLERAVQAALSSGNGVH